MAQKQDIRLKLEQKQARRVAAIKAAAASLLEQTPEEIIETAEAEADKNPAIERDTQNNDPGQRMVVSTNGLSSKAVQFYENTASNPVSLNSFMEEQINESDLDEKQRVIANYIVGNLDNNGYLERDTYSLSIDISSNESTYIDEEEVIEVLKHIQSMKPAGIAARDLQECLLLQLDQRNTSLTPLARTMIENHFKDFINNRRDRIATALGVSQETVNDIYTREIRKLDPKPGGSFDSPTVDRPLQVTPTFIITVEDDEINMEIPNRVPELYVSQSYKDVADELDSKDDLSDDEKVTKDAIEKNIMDAEVFISAMQMRKETLKQTMDAILRIQRQFFLSNGDETTLKPMRLEDISIITGRDKSVLSRATNGKYVKTPWGIMSLRDLFSEGTTRRNHDGEEETISTREIKALIKEIIDNEDKTSPLSDSALCELLEQRGYTVKRRTINKYRDQLGIPVKSLRKVYQ